MPEGQKDEQIKVPVPAALKRELRIEAAKQGISMAERVRQLVAKARESERQQAAA